MKKSTTEYETEIDIGDDVEELVKIEVTVGFSVEYDRNYGADADGRRDKPTYFVDSDVVSVKYVGEKETITNNRVMEFVYADYNANHRERVEEEAIGSGGDK